MHSEQVVLLAVVEPLLKQGREAGAPAGRYPLGGGRRGEHADAAQAAAVHARRRVGYEQEAVCSKVQHREFIELPC